MNTPDGASNPFASTIAEMTWREVEAAAGRGAVVLWPVGVIEQHGPHLPAGTDVYIPTSTLLGARQQLAEHGVEALVLPAFYWGVNHVSSAFPASYGLSPGLMEAVIAELLNSVAQDGFEHVFCLSGHGDALHNQALHRGIQRAASAGSTCHFHHLLDGPLAERIGVNPEDPQAVILPQQIGAPELESTFADVHAGDWESSLMLTDAGELVRPGFTKLRDTRLESSQLKEWRRGGEHARAVTPEGYLGNPSAATPDRGTAWWEAKVTATTKGILHALEMK